MAIEAGNLCLQGMVLKPLNRVSRNNFIIQSSGSALVVYNSNKPNNPKFNIVAYFDSNYDITTWCFKLFFEFFHELVS
jgi:uncharacterized phage-like protein YoqJ